LPEDRSRTIGVPWHRWVKCERLLELRFSPGKIPVVLDLVATQHGMGMGQG
jgi:hypothetical protein